MRKNKFKLNKHYERTTEGLREMLFDQIEALNKGEIDHSQARAAANLARQIVESVRIQIQYQRVLNETAEPLNLIGK